MLCQVRYKRKERCDDVAVCGYSTTQMQRIQANEGTRSQKHSTGLERDLTSCWDQVPVWDEEFVPVMLLQDVRENLQGEAFLLTSLLVPLIGVHFGVGQVSIIVLVICEEECVD